MAPVITLSAVDLVLRVAGAAEGACESPPNTNAGPYVARVLQRTKTPIGSPWCAAFVADIGVQALGEAWPMVRSASVQQCCEWAESKGVRYVPKATGKGVPQVGDCFALWFPSLNRWAHIGFVTRVVKGTTVETIEGNTSGAGSRDGWLVARRTRTLTAADRLIRWAEAMP